MKKIVLLAMLMGVMFSGCFVDKMYDDTKVIYVKGKEVIITNADLLDDKTLEALKELDDKITKPVEIKSAVDVIDRIERTREIIER